MPGAPDDLADTIEAQLARSGLSLADVEGAPADTIVPRTRAGDTGDPTDDESAGALLEALVREASGGSGRITLHGTLGEGGMGIVRLGTQRSLGREVAVKTLREEMRSERAVEKLLREAWITGALEHPNIVPVHDLMAGEDGAPVLVLKRIEGEDWLSLIDDEDEVRARFGARDLLEWNLSTLLSVSNAVRYAHDRGIVHRDLKPENVMIGAFGEVYVVDWGIAVSLEDDGSGRLPLASEAKGLAGTPRYMAPEMLGHGTQDERTDVYLLGAILFRIVTGRPPHEGERMIELISSVLRTPPPIPREVPAPLTAILRRALALDPSDRYADVDAFRRAIQTFLQHRDAARVEAAAELRRERLEARLDQELDEAGRREVLELFREARFGYRQALEIAPEQVSAAAGLAALTVRMIEHALAIDEPDTASAWLAELAEPPAELSERVEAARREKRRETSEARELIRDLDWERGARARFRLSALLGVFWVAAPLVTEIGRATGLREPSHQDAVVLQSVFFLLIAIVGYALRRQIRASAYNRLLGRTTLVAMGGPIVLAAVDWVRGLPWQDTARSQVVCWAIIAAMLGITMDPWMMVAAGVYVVGAAALVAWPEMAFLVMTIGNLAMFGTLLRLAGRALPSRILLDDSAEGARRGGIW